MASTFFTRTRRRTAYHYIKKSKGVGLEILYSHTHTHTLLHQMVYLSPICQTWPKTTREQLMHWLALEQGDWIFPRALAKLHKRLIFDRNQNPIYHMWMSEESLTSFSSLLLFIGCLTFFFFEILHVIMCLLCSRILYELITYNRY